MAARSFIVRRLPTGNALDLRELNLVFGEAFGEPDTYGAEPPRDAYLEELLASEGVIALIAPAEGQLVAGAIAFEL
jgi:aminoglycoside 3-N-acetyltransferase I